MNNYSYVQTMGEVSERMLSGEEQERHTVVFIMISGTGVKSTL